MRVGVDTGGTFTDVVANDGSVVKIPSTPRDPASAVGAGIEALGLGRPVVLAHGTTVPVNALLQRQGARVALVATRGFADIIEIARQSRPSLYDTFVDRPTPLVPRELRFEITGRIDASGHRVNDLDFTDLDAIPNDVDAVAVCLLHADLDATDEIAVAQELRNRGMDVNCSHEVSPEFREYERTVTTVANAYLRPICRRYLEAIDDLGETVLVMTSAGGLVPAREAAATPAALLLSGPAGGVRAASALVTACGFGDAVAFDMGGTSTDVCLIRGGEPEPTASHVVGGFPIRLPSLSIHTIGAGGGSIARIDAGGALVVGPNSAGAVPGPACYGSGTEPTVTDADLVLGRIPEGSSFPGIGVLRTDLARTALAHAGVSAEGVVRVVDASIERAVRLVTVSQGVDPRELVLVAFGGAGPLHACAIAEALEMRAVIIPPRAGVFSAVGLLTSPMQRDLVRSWPTPRSTDGLADALRKLENDVSGLLEGSPMVESFVDCRYEGQSHEITVSSIEEFAIEHERRNGYMRPGVQVEVIALRARAQVAAQVDPAALPALVRHSARGPEVISEPDCTIWIPNGWRAEPGPIGALLLERSEQ